MPPPGAAEISCLCTQTRLPGCPEGQPAISLILISYGAQDLPARPHYLVATVGSGHTPLTRDTYTLPAEAAASRGMGTSRKPHHLSQTTSLRVSDYRLHLWPEMSSLDLQLTLAWYTAAPMLVL